MYICAACIHKRIHTGISYINRDSHGGWHSGLSSDLVHGLARLVGGSLRRFLTLLFRAVGNFMSKIFTIKAANFFVITVRRSVISFTKLITSNVIWRSSCLNLIGVCMHKSFGHRKSLLIRRCSFIKSRSRSKA